MKKKLIISLIFAFLLIFSAVPTLAADRGHVIRSWHTSVNISANNTAQITETILVDFTQARHGFYRTIPYIVAIEKETDGELRDISYRVRIRDLLVSGAPLSTSNENGVKILQIGDENKTVFGEQKYVISYTLDFGDDRVSEHDEIFFTLLGADNAALVERFSFDVSFEKPLPSPQDLQIFSGAYGNTSDSDVEYSVTANSLNGKALSSIDTGSAVTMYARLPEGYFENERLVTPFFPYLALAAAIILLGFALTSRYSQARKAPVETVEFTAPDGISSAEVGYIIDSMSEDKDILSLIIWFASKGYLAISGEENDLTLTKLKPLAPNAPVYQKVFFSSLFGSDDTCLFKDAGTRAYAGLQAAKMQLPTEFANERKLYSAAWTALSFILPFICGLIYIAGALLITDFVSAAGIVFSVISGVLIIAGGVVSSFGCIQWAFASMGKRAGFVIGALVPIAIGSGLSIFVNAVSVTGFSFFATALYVACAAAAFACSRLAKPSDYNVEISGKLLGLKNFIKTAELERLEALVADNPRYFYDVLPYAYVFGLTELWAKQFEGIAVPAPSWYDGTWHMSYFNMYWLTRSISSAHNHMISENATAQMKSGGKGGTPFGGGGGFSGGGFGGGGSGSW